MSFPQARPGTAHGMDRISAGAPGGGLDRIVALACRLEPSAVRLAEWLHNVPIPRLDDRTVIELVQLGQGERVVDLLRSALQQETQDAWSP